MTIDESTVSENNYVTSSDATNVNGQLQNDKLCTKKEGVKTDNSHLSNDDGTLKHNEPVGESNGKSEETKECIHLNGVQKQVISDPPSILPFSLLPGEILECHICGNEANVFLTNYRLFFCTADTFFNVPVKAIEYVELRDMKGLNIHCRNGKVTRLGFDTPEDCSELWRQITSNEASFSKIDELFAFEYFRHYKEDLRSCPAVTKPVECEAAMYVREIKRLGFTSSKIWRTTEINSKFEICETYPKFHIVPARITDDELRKSAHFRAMKRFPSVIWRNSENGAVIVRSSQPEVGWLGWRNQFDEKLLQNIAEAAMLESGKNEKCNMSVSVKVNVTNDSPPPPILLVDARSYAAAVANRAKGGGCECQEYYPNCDIQFMNLPNIHAIRKSFQSVRALCLLGKEQSNWYSALEATRWIHNLSLLIHSTLTIVEAMDIDGRSTVVHCSDGWDRTPQLVSLTQLLMDPYYRTIKGFRILIEREWLEFGHKFADRCGHSTGKDINERSPVFLQWLDAVHQVMKQFPSAFEFNELFLIKLLEHSYSCLFGTFLCNNIHERQKNSIQKRTRSLWDFLLSGRKDFINYLYETNSKSKVLYPNFHMRCLHLWENVFLNCNTTDEINQLTEITDAMSMSNSDSGNYTASLSSQKGIRESRKFSRDNSRKTSTSSNNNSYLTCSGEHSAPKVDDEGKHKEGETFPPSSLALNSNKKENHSINNQDNYQINVNSNVHSKIHNDISDDITIFSSSRKIEDSTICCETSKSCISNGKNSNDTMKNENSLSNALMDSTLSDSVRTLTGENLNTSQGEHRKSQDDLCVGLSSGIDPSILSLDHRTNNMRRTHSSPDSPTMNRLARTKSVPDVMTSSVCVNSDVAKQFTNVKDNIQLFKRYQKLIDQDGLTLSYSYLDKKLIDIELKHSQEITKLQKKLDLERQARLYLQQQQCRDGIAYSPSTFSDGVQDDMLSLPDSVNGERSSISSVSNDDGWEQVQFDDVIPTRWIPDHLSTHCFKCGFQFNIMYRKHHCRKCGRVFCDPCSNQKISVPDEQLYNPVRVCLNCYDQLTMFKE